MISRIFDHEYSEKSDKQKVFMSTQRFVLGNKQIQIKHATNQQTHFLCSIEAFGIRTLFTRDSLGITAYVENRNLESSYTTNVDEFKMEFQQIINSTGSFNLLVDHIKKYLHLMGNQRDDIELLWNALRVYRIKRDKWQRTSQFDRKKDYIFGPITMRALHYHELPYTAIQVKFKSTHLQFADHLA